MNTFIKEEKIITMLNSASVSILTKQYTGDRVINSRCAYPNTDEGRELISSNEPDFISSKVLEYWNSNPVKIDIDNALTNNVVEDTLQ